MPKARTPFEQVIHQLQAAYGRPEPAKATDPLEMILLENVAYLVSDQRRQAAFNALRKRVGASPARILTAPAEVLLEVARLGGMLPDQRVRKLHLIAEIAMEDFQGDLRKALSQQSLAQAKKSLKKFPGIGDPGAEKILLFSRRFPVLALDSNGLRALVRLGFGAQLKNYAATYRSAQEAVKGQAPENFDWLIRAHQLLRRHGQELCRRSQPLCHACPLTAVCRYYLGAGRVGAQINPP